MSDSQRRIVRIKPLIVVGLVVLFGGVYGLLSGSGTLETLLDFARLQQEIRRLGLLGPLAIVGLLILSVVISPIPSAPIALASGMAFGPLRGGLYVLIGAEIGALIAFFIARGLGYEAMRRRFGERLDIGLLGSQNAMTGLVAALRLIPFFSFDLVSYACGLTPLKPWRFALATLVGVTPASFALAFFGGELVAIDFGRIALLSIPLGAVTLVPAVVVLLRRRRGAARVTETD